MSYYNGKRILLAGLKGDSVFIRYSASADGSYFTDKWNPGQLYMGVATGQSAPNDKSKYVWSKVANDLNLNKITMEATFEDGTTTTYKLYGEIVGSEVPDKPNVTKMTFDNNGVIDNTGTVVPMGEKRHTNIIALSDLADGPDGYCVQKFDPYYTRYPKVVFFSENSLSTFIRGFTVAEIDNKSSLTVAEIKDLAATVDGAMYVAFNSDYEDQSEDHVYIVSTDESVT